MLKTLREFGFDATGFDRRDRVGGLWSYTTDTRYTTALLRTFAPVSPSEAREYVTDLCRRDAGQHQQAHVWILGFPHA